MQGETAQTPAEQVKKVFEVNTLGTIYMTQAVLPSMHFRNRGHILNIISTAGIEAQGAWTIYTASKYGMRGFTDALKQEYKELELKLLACIKVE